MTIYSIYFHNNLSEGRKNNRGKVVIKESSEGRIMVKVPESPQLRSDEESLSEQASAPMPVT